MGGSETSGQGAGGSEASGQGVGGSETSGQGAGGIEITRGGAAARMGGDGVPAALREVPRIAVWDEHRGVDELAQRDGYALTRGAIAVLIELYR